MKEEHNKDRPQVRLSL